MLSASIPTPDPGGDHELTTSSPMSGLAPRAKVEKRHRTPILITIQHTLHQQHALMALRKVQLLHSRCIPDRSTLLTDRNLGRSEFAGDRHNEAAVLPQSANSMPGSRAIDGRGLNCRHRGDMANYRAGTGRISDLLINCVYEIYLAVACNQWDFSFRIGEFIHVLISTGCVEEVHGMSDK